ncbi:MAG: alpha/beta hydrolase [Bacteroidota bacterium]
MRLIFLFLLQSVILISYSQEKTNIYFFPGQGSDKRIFDSLTFIRDLDSNFTLTFFEYETLEKRTSLNDFANTFVSKIDTNQKVILIGVSLGGMICAELNELIKTEKTILISSAKFRKELPFRYKFQKYIPIYKIIPARMLLGGAKFLQPIVEPDRKKNKQTFKSMLKAKKPKYIKRSIEMIIKWDKEKTPNSDKIIHIHGTKDHTLPHRKVKATYTVKKGSHMMTLTRASEINEILKEKIIP